MRVTIYADVLFAINFAADYAVLAALALLFGLKMDKKCICRMLAAALFGGLYGAAAAMPGLEMLASVWAKGLSGLLLVLIAFPFLHIRAFVKKCAAFLLLSLLFGGLIFAVKLAAVGQYGRLPTILLFLLLPAGFAGVCFLARVLARRRALPDHADLLIAYHGKSVRVSLLLDTGNRLCDPLSGAPVLVVSHAALTPLFADLGEVWEGIKSGCNETLPPGFRLLVYQDAGGKHALLPVFRPDYICLPGYEKQEARQVLIGVSADVFDETGRYQGLMHPDQIVKHMKVI